MRAVIMGVAGSGKSSVGASVAKRLGTIYLDGDDLHPPANIAKMSGGIPLTDEDRAPWLDQVGATLAQQSDGGLIGCSALRRAYRDRIRAASEGPVAFLHLAGSRNVIEGRMSAREGHFMPVALLNSQFATLEALEADEAGCVIDIDQPFASVVGAAVTYLQQSDF
ncbi:gluconokinase [Actibacterium sp. 188UL27-1]|uniref:gluconokinase n=1 Tax=Actibacterium sp. 188UL27-1 TaxID=2786961 RepID=UPI00195AD4A3|nr:gluconokinase [Actibacterium sp. 188UL27-1]MBM7069752.1 gluconokinase [Actibacterium sp. 188UL27-1]